MKKFILILTALFTGTFGYSKTSVISRFHFQSNAFQLTHEARTDTFPFKIGTTLPFIDYFNNQYLFDKWVKGTVITSNNIEISNESYYFNYDKISNNLLLTTDLKEIIEIDKREFKAFYLKDGANEYHFEHKPIIDNKKFFQVLVKNEKYSLYKWTLTKIKKRESFSSFFWELVDSYFYYVVFPNGRLYREIDLKRKSIEKNLFIEPEKIDSYFSLHQYNEIDETLLVDLINYLNK